METPKSPSITSANLPKLTPPVAPKGSVSSPGPTQAAANAPVSKPSYDDDDVYMGPSIIKARPLGDPDMANLRPKNPMHILYWANRTYQNGFRVNYRIAQRFRLARKDDIANLPLDDKGNCYLIDPTGAIVDGDRVLMIIGKNAYEGALLHNHNSAIRRGNKFGQVHQNWKEDGEGNLVPIDQPTDVVRATVDEVRATPQNKQKIRSFVPGPAEIEGMLGSSSVPEKP